MSSPQKVTASKKGNKNEENTDSSPPVRSTESVLRGQTPRDGEEWLRRVVDGIQDGLVITEHGKVVYANDRACEIFGFIKSEFIRLDTLELVAPEERERLKRIMEESWETGIPTKELEFWIVQKDGTRRCVHNRYSLNRKGDEITGRSILVTDITRRKIAEESILKENEELRTANQKLKERDKTKNEFISILAHDLGTPLVVMQGNLEMMTMWPEEKLIEKMPRKIDTLLRSVKRLDKLRKDTLSLSHIDLGTMRMEKEFVLVNKLIEEAVEDIRKLAEDKDQTISVDLPDLELVHCDREKIRQAFDNYLSNAIQYTDDGGKIELGGERDEEKITVWIKDTGRGISSHELEKVFRRFYRTGMRVKGSTGLGLSIVKGIVEAHGGRAWCESEGEGKGSTFYLTIPIGSDEEEQR